MKKKNILGKVDMVAHIFNSRVGQEDLNEFKASLICEVLGQPGLHRETLSQTNKEQ